MDYSGGLNKYNVRKNILFLQILFTGRSIRIILNGERRIMYEGPIDVILAKQKKTLLK
jgi:hypothetical protein